MTVFHRAFHLAHHIFPQGGTCLEFGVYTGTSYCYQADQIHTRYPASRLIGFDSWQGLPQETLGVWHPEVHAVGKLAASKDKVLQRLKLIGLNPGWHFRLVDGFFAESLTQELQSEIKDLIFVNIDVDIYRSTVELLDFVQPLLRPGVILYWDDWNSPPYEMQPGPWGEQLAWEHWVQKQEQRFHVETIEINPVNQRTMLVTEVGEERLPPAVCAGIRRKAYDMTCDSEVK